MRNQIIPDSNQYEQLYFQIMVIIIADKLKLHKPSVQEMSWVSLSKYGIF